MASGDQSPPCTNDSGFPATHAASLSRRERRSLATPTHRHTCGKDATLPTPSLPPAMNTLTYEASTRRPSRASGTRMSHQCGAQSLTCPMWEHVLAEHNATQWPHLRLDYPMINDGGLARCATHPPNRKPRALRTYMTKTPLLVCQLALCNLAREGSAKGMQCPPRDPQANGDDAMDTTRLERSPGQCRMAQKAGRQPLLRMFGRERAES